MALANAFNSCVLYLIGFPGVGKLTVAREIMSMMPFRLIDNHSINNPIFNLHRVDGKTPFPEFVWDDVHKVRDIVMTSARKAPSEFNFILTNALADTPDDKKIYEDNVAFADVRNACFIPVVLTCDIDENSRRIVSADRETNMKETNPESPATYHQEWRLLPIEHPNLLSLDTTNMSAKVAAEKIVGHVSQRMDLHV